MPKQPETRFKERVIEDLKALRKDYGRLYWVKTQQVCIRGTPDILVCVDGLFVALELKRDASQKPDPLQTFALDQIRAAGGATFVASPENWRWILDRIERRIRLPAQSQAPSSQAHGNGRRRPIA